MKKKLVSVVVIVILVGLFLSCASGPPANALGYVEATFESRDALRQANVGMNLIAAAAMDAANAPANIRLNRAAEEALLEVARTIHGENVDVTRVSRTLIGHNPHTRLYQYSARGYVIPGQGGTN